MKNKKYVTLYAGGMLILTSLLAALISLHFGTDGVIITLLLMNLLGTFTIRYNQ